MTNKSHLFDHLNFLLVISATFTQEQVEETILLLNEHGANQCVIYSEDGSSSPWSKQQLFSRFQQEINCIISSTSDFPFYRVASFDLLIPVVAPTWIESCVSTNRIVRASNFSPDQAHVLKNCQIYISKQSISATECSFYISLINTLGGFCIDFLSSRATHIITLDPQDPAIAAVTHIGKKDIRFVLPTWLVSVFKKGQHVDETPHLLDPYDKPETTKDKLLDLWEEVNTFKITNNNGQILKNHSFFLAMDLQFSREGYNFFIEIIESMGGSIVRHLDSTDIKKAKGDCFIGFATKTKEFQAAQNEKLYCGNVAWIFFMWSMQEFVSPSSKLLLSPLRPKIFHKNELLLSYTNYLGQQRFYIQKLVEALGGASTTELSKKNTHVLSCMPYGQKYQAAVRWSDTCKVVNHLWLEECYKFAKKLDTDTTRYREIPVCGGLKNALGQLSLEDYEENIEKQELHEEKEQLSTITDTQENFDTVTSNAVFDMEKKEVAISEKEVQSGISSVGHLFEGLSDNEQSRNEDQPVKRDELLEEKRRRQQSTIESTTPAASRQSSALNNGDRVEEATPSPIPMTPPPLSSTSTGSGRKAKAKAAMKLHTDIEALNEFQRNSKRKRTGDLLPEEIQKLKQLKQLESTVKELIENIATPEQVGRHHKLPYDINAVCTGCHESIGELDLEVLKKLGIRISNDITPHTNTVIAPKKMRTAKFLTSFSFHPLKYALVPEFITDVLKIVYDATDKKNIVLSLESYFIPGVSVETLRKTELPTKVFERCSISHINIADDVPGGVEVISPILEAHGITKVHELGKKFTKEDIIMNNGKKGAPVFIFVATKATQAKRFAKMCEGRDVGKVLVVEWNWCVKGIFNLEVDFADKEFVIYNK